MSLLVDIPLDGYDLPELRAHLRATGFPPAVVELFHGHDINSEELKAACLPGILDNLAFTVDTYTYHQQRPSALPNAIHYLAQEETR